MASEVKPWEQRPKESDQAFQAFQAFRDMGPGRNVADAYRQVMGNPQASQPPGTWNVWRKKHAWVDRARDWDNRAVQVAQAKVERIVAFEAEWWAQEASKQAREGLELGKLLREKARAYASFPVAEARKTEVVKDAKGNDVSTTTIVQPLDPRGLAAAARVAREAEDIIWRAIEQGRNLAREADDRTGPTAVPGAVVNEAARRVAEAARQHRENLMGRDRTRPPWDQPAPPEDAPS